MKNLVFVTCQEFANLTTDDQITLQPLARAGIQIQPAVWTDIHFDWQQVRLAVIRSTWDYTENYSNFLAWLDRIEKLQVLTCNPISILRWNSDKKYLADLEHDGNQIVPTQFLKSSELSQAIAESPWPKLVCKPRVSASARNTFVIKPSEKFKPVNSIEDWMLQPYIESIATQGELSLIYFNKKFSHAVRKIPKPEDFRSQEEHGATLFATTPASEARQVAQRLLDSIPEDLLYARVDLVVDKNKWLVMELELIEPSLYFLFADAQAPERFQLALLEHLK